MYSSSSRRRYIDECGGAAKQRAEGVAAEQRWTRQQKRVVSRCDPEHCLLIANGMREIITGTAQIFEKNILSLWEVIHLVKDVLRIYTPAKIQDPMRLLKTDSKG
ncbi:hypothetical protein GGX14DRAFT_389209 [Mycena pura]|uniref:Uncharacterized protein n=1 Tax=Mycena pura TaxID=153505 RepID=A0AAD6VVB2_9AGAR|nr:hypothetical protein GGX14DRAFT_389209 [Mycena pura]